MPKGTTFDNDLLKLIFQATAIANVADNAASGPLTNLYVALHTGDPSAGNQNTSESLYSGYARVAVSRNSSGWTVTGANAVNAGAITFPACNGGTNSTVTHASIGKNASGVAGEVYYSGALNNSLAISNGITPSFGASNLTVTES
jgi:hypothetical protein